MARFRRRYRRGRKFRKRGFKRRRINRRFRRPRRRIGRVNRILRKGFKRNYWFARKSSTFPTRIYTKLLGHVEQDFSYKSAVSSEYWAIRVFPQDPNSWWDFLAGSAGVTLSPGATTFVINAGRYCSSSTGYRKFRYTKCKVTLKVTNYTGTSGNGSTSGQIFNQVTKHGEVVAGMMPIPYNGTFWTVPTNDEWPTALEWKYKNIPMPHSTYVWDDTGADLTYNTLGYSPKSTKTIKKTFRPWRIERVKKSSYMIDDDYETTLSTTAGTASNVPRKHELNLFVFNPWHLNTAYNELMELKIQVVIKLFGYFYQPREVFG